MPAVVNRDLHASMRLTCAVDIGTDVVTVMKDGTLRPAGKMRFHRDIEPGDLVIFSWIE